MSDELKNGQELQKVLDDLRKPFHPSQVTWKPGAVKGERALALAYADLRAYMNRLDEVCGTNWAVAYEPWGEDRLICRLTIMGVTRSSTGETTNESERSEIGGTVAEAQAFKRASAMFGLGRYLYNLPTVWADFDPATKQFTEKAKARLTGILVQHYRRSTDTESEMADLFGGESHDTESHAGNGNASNGKGSNGAGHKEAAQPVATPKKAASKRKATLSPELAELFTQFNALGEDLYGNQWEKVCRRNVNRISHGKTEESDEMSQEQIEQLISGMMKLKSKREPEAVLS